MSIPVIDISPLLTKDNSDGAVQRVLSEIHSVSQDISFFHVTGHGIDTQSIYQSLDYVRKLFDLSVKKKQSLHFKQSEGYDGYRPLAAETFGGYVYRRETFYIGPRDRNSNEKRGSMPSDSDLPGFNDFFDLFTQKLSSLGYTLVQAITSALGADKQIFEGKFDNPVAWLGLMHYPPFAGDITDAWGVASHQDYNLLTLLLQDHVGGLEVEARDGSWIEVKPVPDAFIVNYGNIMEGMTRGLYRSAFHRVRTNSTRSRYSIPFFYGPNADFVVSPIDTQVIKASIHEPTILQQMPFLYGDFHAMKNKEHH